MWTRPRACVVGRPCRAGWVQCGQVAVTYVRDVWCKSVHSTSGVCHTQRTRACPLLLTKIGRCLICRWVFALQGTRVGRRREETGEGTQRLGGHGGRRRDRAHKLTYLHDVVRLFSRLSCPRLGHARDAVRRWSHPRGEIKTKHYVQSYYSCRL